MQERIKNSIKSYIEGNDNRPLIIDVSSAKERDEFLQSYFQTSKKSVFDLALNKAELPEISDLYEYMNKCTEKIAIINDLGPYLKLYGKDSIQQEIHALLEKSFATKFIILTFQCSKFICEKNPRSKTKVIIEDSDYSVPASLVFIDSELKDFVSAEVGLNKALKKFERSSDKLYILTDYKKSNFEDALFSIEECKTPYDLLCLKDPTTKKIQSKFGTTEDWSMLLKKLTNNSVEETISEFINTKNFIKNIEEWVEKTDFEKWLIFIYAKLKNKRTENWAIDFAIEKSKKSSEFLRNIYDSILDVNPKETDYWDKYTQRKQILKKIKDDSVIYEFCKYVQTKNENAIYYLTDNNDVEKKLIIQLLGSYYECYLESKIKDALKHIYSDLHNYLSEFNFGNQFFNEYFSTYKYLKVTNHLTPEFKEVVDREACERSYKRVLMCRAEKLEEMSFDDTIVYFIDALGAEFSSFIERKCEEKGLAVSINVARANLPTLTSENTEFRDFFAKKGVEVKDEKSLDSLIHDGKNDYDFDKNKLPIHIVEEFEIIDRCLTNIRKNIKSGKCQKAIIVSDHGATRLAILNTDMIKIDVESVGEHGGRVCKAYPEIEVIPNAVIENEYCVLGDYNVFKGGRVGKVEMHGGATLEEVVVPIIEISERNTSIEIRVLTSVIKVSYKTKAKLKFYTNTKLSNVTVHINGTSYSASTVDGNNFEAELSDIKKSAEYEFEVWANGKFVSANNTFKVEKESAKTNDLWG